MYLLKYILMLRFKIYNSFFRNVVIISGKMVWYIIKHFSHTFGIMVWPVGSFYSYKKKTELFNVNAAYKKTEAVNEYFCLLKTAPRGYWMEWRIQIPYSKFMVTRHYFKNAIHVVAVHIIVVSVHYIGCLHLKLYSFRNIIC